MKYEANKYRALERVIKGFANHRRLQIMELLDREPELSVSNISEKLKIGYENTSDHISKMAASGLVLKKNRGVEVVHKLSPRAKDILVFCKKLK